MKVLPSLKSHPAGSTGSTGEPAAGVAGVVGGFGVVHAVEVSATHVVLDEFGLKQVLHAHPPAAVLI
jgi:hypothetical protein